MGTRKSTVAPGIYKRDNDDSSKSFVAQVRISPFKPTSKTFWTKQAAIDWQSETERSLRSQKARGSDRADLPALTVQTLANEFLADPEVKPLAYFDDLERLVAWWVNEFGTQRVTDVGVLKLRAARDKLIGTGDCTKAPATVNRYLSAFRACWNWGRTAGLIPQERSWPTRVLLTEPNGRVRYLSDDELANVLAAAAKHSTTMHTAIVVSLATGMRQGELLRLEWADIDTDRQTVRILQTKNGEARAVHLPPVAVDALKTLRRSGIIGRARVFLDGNGKGLTKAGLAKRWNIVRANADLEDFHWHDLRHSCASFLAQRGASLLEIGSVLGHKSPSVTQRYAHLVAGRAVTGHAALDEKLRGST